MKIILGLIAALIIYNALARQAGGVGRDFQAYYKAGMRVLDGSDPYVFEESYPYKYGPATVAVFLPFQLFSYEIARWIYCALHIITALGIVVLNLKLLQKARTKITSEIFFGGIVIGFVGSLRFLDGEFQTSQISLAIYLSTLIGVLLLAKPSRWAKRAGVLVLAMVSQMKIHSTVMWYALTKKLWQKRQLLLLVPAVILYLLPNPLWWIEWARQIKETTPLLPSGSNAFNRQGFFGAAVMIFNWNEYGLGPWLLSFPFALYAAIKLPRFKIADIDSHNLKALFLSLLAWMLWGFMTSPLPWQHTYSLLWGVIPLLWMNANTALQRRAIFFSSMLLGLTPKGIMGEGSSQIFERYQGPLILILILWFVLIAQAQRASPDLRQRESKSFAGHSANAGCEH